MAFARTWLRVSLCVGFLVLPGCGELKKPPPPPDAATAWRAATVVAVKSVTVDNRESAGARAAVGLWAGFIPGAIMAGAATEKGLGTSAVWEYTLNDKGAAVTVRSFAIAGPGECVRYASNTAGHDVPLERIPQEYCPAS